MLPAGHHLWQLCKAEDSLGLSCTSDGLFLGRAPLIERRNGSFAARPQSDLERLLIRAYGADIALDRIAPGLATVASALNKKNLCLAQIAAVHLRLPDLPDTIARLGLEAEDFLIKSEWVDEQIVRASWHESQHPRSGTSPNPGWFAPKDRPTEDHTPSRLAAGEREERRPEEELDPLAEVRQAQWDAKVALLRRIDPNNPNLTYFANPNSAPSQEAVDRLDSVIEAASIKRVTDKVMPGGAAIGKVGNSPRVRELPGGLRAAKELFDYLSVGGTVEERNPQITMTRLPGRAGYVTFRPRLTSGPPAVDVNVPGIPFRRIHFP